MHREYSRRYFGVADGHHLSIIEHTVNVLFLPGLHTGAGTSSSDSFDSCGGENGDLSTSMIRTVPPSATSTSFNIQHNQPPRPSLAVPGLEALKIPSPLHLQLHVLTRLSFNEQGRITHHRDFWDVRDVLGLVPGMSAAQWIATRVAAKSLSLATRVAGWAFNLGGLGGSGGVVGRWKKSSKGRHRHQQVMHMGRMYHSGNNSDMEDGWGDDASSVYSYTYATGRAGGTASTSGVSSGEEGRQD